MLSVIDLFSLHRKNINILNSNNDRPHVQPSTRPKGVVGLGCSCYFLGQTIAVGHQWPHFHVYYSYSLQSSKNSCWMSNGKWNIKKGETLVNISDFLFYYTAIDITSDPVFRLRILSKALKIEAIKNRIAAKVNFGSIANKNSRLFDLRSDFIELK